MGMFRGKNAKMYSMIVAVAAVIIFIFIYVVNMKDKSADSKELATDNSELSQVLNKDLEESYPASVREVMKFYCRVLSCMFNEELTDEQFTKIVDQERAMYDEELLKANEYGSFVENQKTEVAAFKNSKNKLVNYVIEKNEDVETWYNDDKECASIIVRINVSGSELVQKDQKFMFRRDENNKWKIFGWKEVNITGIDEEPSINDIKNDATAEPEE